MSADYMVVSGLFLGWGLGANASANFFGTAVATNCVRYRTAVILIVIFAIAGAIIEGPRLYHGYALSPTITVGLAFLASLGAAVTMCLMTWFSLPASGSQAAIGGLMGIAIWASGIYGAEWGKLSGWIFCWVLTPLSSGLIAFFCMKLMGPVIRHAVVRVEILNLIYKIGLILCGCYGAYILGANNVVVTTGPFFSAGLFGDPSRESSAVIAAACGGLSIALGALTYSRKVMMTVGRGITALDPFSALVAVLAHSLAMHLFTELHVPVSSSQAIVGAVAGVGFSKGMKTINSRILGAVLGGWLLVPTVSGLLAFCTAFLSHAGR